MIRPRQPVPELRLPLVGGGTFDLTAERPERFTLLTFYRGLHCPICRAQLADLERKVDDFAERGVRLVAISMDDAERAERTRNEWSISKVPIAYGLTAEQARAWGLFLSTSNGMTSAGVVEPDIFSEPGLHLVRADGTLYFASLQTMPFARPHYADVLGALDYIIKNDYPARGEVAQASPDGATATTRA